jgi:hypothetical protein
VVNPLDGREFVTAGSQNGDRRSRTASAVVCESPGVWRSWLVPGTSAGLFAWRRHTRGELVDRIDVNALRKLLQMLKPDVLQLERHG